MIVVNLDVLMEKRINSRQELAKKIGITKTN